MRWVIVLGLVLLVGGGIALAGAQQFNEQYAQDISCANWIGLANDSSTDAYRTGYATAVIAVIYAKWPNSPNRTSSSAIRNAAELVTGITSVCAGTPQKRLVDVALYLLGAR